MARSSSLTRDTLDRVVLQSCGYDEGRLCLTFGGWQNGTLPQARQRSVKADGGRGAALRSAHSSPGKKHLRRRACAGGG